MSKVLEKSLGGFITSILGSGSSSNSPFDSYNTSGSSFISLGLINYVERLQAARKISKQEEEDIVTEEYQEWLRQASNQNIKNEIISDYLCRSLIAFSRGHYCTNLHINAIKLTQSDRLLHKKIGYLYISRTMAPGSDLTVLLVNTVQRDLSSSHVIHVSLGLSLLPVIISLDVSSLVSSSLVSCLNHQQPYIKRRAAIMASALILQNQDTQGSFALLVPHLIQLLSNTEPSVAIAATMSLSGSLKSVDDANISDTYRDEIAKACAHILLQATKGCLSQHYNDGPINAPFVQVQMLRAIRNLSIVNWNPPDELFTAIESVLLQPWGGRNLSLYMTLTEAIATVVYLPRNEVLISQSLNIVLGFLKSSLIDFKYLGIKALACVFSTLEDTLTEAHLKAVLECLDSSSHLLQSRTIRLLCSMANRSNYQAICVTLLEFARKTNNSLTQDLVFNHLADILKRINTDIPWGIAFLSPLLEASDVKACMFDAIRVTISKGVGRNETEEEKEVIVSACNKLFDILLKGDQISLCKLRTVAFILNILFCIKPERININIVELFIEKIKNIEYFESESDDIFECLTSCGLFVPECCGHVKSVLIGYLSGNNINMCLKSREKLLLLNNCDLTKKVNLHKDAIARGNLKPDLTFSFYDKWVVESLEKGAQAYKPFTIKTRSFVKSMDRRTTSFNPFDVKVGSLTTSADKDSVSTESLKSSMCGTSNASGTSPKDRNVWTVKGRIKQLNYDSENETNSLISSCVEIAHEVMETSIIEPDLDSKLNTSSFLDSQKVDLAQALLKGLGLSKH